MDFRSDDRFSALLMYCPFDDGSIHVLTMKAYSTFFIAVSRGECQEPQVVPRELAIQGGHQGWKESMSLI